MNKEVLTFSASKQEELIGAVWIIASVLSFGFGYVVWGWMFAIKGGTDQLTSIYMAFYTRKIRDKTIEEA